MKISIEIVCGNFPSVLVACEANADRIELCSSLSEGGITPSYGLISEAKKHATISLHILIRPRAGDFLYTSGEFEIMKQDIITCKKLGVDGVVIGILKRDGSVDIERTKQLVELAKPMSVTFHRAFDVAKDPMTSLDEIISTGCNRLLTSGQASSALNGAKLISELLKKANGRIVIMPGGGINADNITELLNITGVSEVHSSCMEEIESSMQFRNDGVKMGKTDDAFFMQVTSAAKIQALRKKIDSFTSVKS